MLDIIRYRQNILLYHVVPTCQVRVVRFHVSCPPPFLPSFLPSFLLSFLLLLLARPPLPALDRSGPRRTSTASSRSQWASPDLICQLLIAWASPDLNRRVGALWALPDLNRRDSEHCGPRRTSTGPQRPEAKPYRMPKRMLDRLPQCIPDRMSEDMPDRMSEDMPDGMPDRYAR